MFISFEGIDGSGKSTQARLLAAALRERGRHVVEVREPGGTVLGESLRSILLDPSSDLSSQAEILLFAAARAQLVSDVIRPQLESGATVIADRFADSTLAYQGSGRAAAPIEWLRSLNSFVCGSIQPDMTYLVDVPPAIAKQRMMSRSLDRMENSDRDFFDRVRTGYLALANDSPGRVTVVDGQLTPSEIHTQILGTVLGSTDHA